VHGAARPGPAKVCEHAFVVKDGRYLALRPAFVDEHSVHTPNGLDLVGRAGYQDDSIRLKALLAPAQQLTLRLSLFVDQLPP
jgi:hypothetical protein